MSVPAHKSGTAGQIVTPVGVPAKELVHRGTTVYSPPKSGVNVYEEMRPLKTALAASKSVLAPYPQEPWESRYNRLVGALEEACHVADKRSGKFACQVDVSVQEIRSIIAENT